MRWCGSWRTCPGVIMAESHIVPAKVVDEGGLQRCAGGPDGSVELAGSASVTGAAPVWWPVWW